MSYNPSVGRWMQEDPRGYIDGANRYDFEKNDPTSNLDPSGTVSIGIVNPDDHNGVGGHAFVIVNTPDGPQVYTFTLPEGWYGPIPLSKYLYGRPPGDNINIYQLPDVNDDDLKKELDDFVKKGSYYAKGGAICSTESARALEGINIPNDLKDLLDQFDSRDGVKGPSWLEYYIAEYAKKHNGTVTTIKGNSGGPKSSGSSSSSSSSSSSFLWWWFSS